MQQHVGYSLVDLDSGAELQCWGDAAGQCAGVPEQIRLPNGDIIHCAPLGSLDIAWHPDAWGPTVRGLALVARWLVDDPPSPGAAIVNTTVAYDGTRVVVTRVY